jgi:phosphohistidine phosphatase
MKAFSSLMLLVRHGRAEDEGPLGDGARALTGKGRQEMREHAAEVAGHVRLTGIATSPLVRAVQTAEILAEACGLSEVVVRGDLDYRRASGEGLCELADELGVGWALVGHNPSMGEAVPRLLGRRDTAVRFRKGAVMAFTPASRGGWTLAWVAAPGRGIATALEEDAATDER